MVGPLSAGGRREGLCAFGWCLRAPFHGCDMETSTQRAPTSRGVPALGGPILEGPYTPGSPHDLGPHPRELWSQVCAVSGPCTAKGGVGVEGRLSPPKWVCLAGGSTEPRGQHVVLVLSHLREPQAGFLLTLNFLFV